MTITPQEPRAFMARQQVRPYANGDARYYDNVESIRASLEEIARLAGFVRKWTPWLVGAIGIAYPAIGHVITAISVAGNLPGAH
jgi:hypothetical protein